MFLSQTPDNRELDSDFVEIRSEEEEEEDTGKLDVPEHLTGNTLHDFRVAKPKTPSVQPTDQLRLRQL